MYFIKLFSSLCSNLNCLYLWFRVWDLGNKTQDTKIKNIILENINIFQKVAKHSKNIAFNGRTIIGTNKLCNIYIRCKKKKNVLCCNLKTKSRLFTSPSFNLFVTFLKIEFSVEPRIWHIGEYDSIHVSGVNQNIRNLSGKESQKIQ